MAQPITLQLPPRDPKRELVERLEQAPAEHAAALLDGYELLQQLYEHGVFTLIRGGLGATDKLVDAASSGANSTEAIRAIRNAIILSKMLGSIDPDFLQGVSTAVGETFGSVKSVPANPPSMFALVTGFASRDLRRSIALVNTFLKRFAYQLKIRSNADMND
jgi:uncharacterized protein YjgD (DUF1641 family)